MSHKLQQYRYIYFLGIGGIGMSALARWCMHQGKKVFGYDKTPSPLTDQLSTEGIDIHFNDVLEAIPQEILDHRDQSLIVYTPAIPKVHLIWNHLIAQEYEVKKRAVVLGMISKEHFTLAVAGTHGKTSTSAMIAHLLKAAGKTMVAFVGGILKKENSNYLHHGDITQEDTFAVIEADEFDRSFHQLSPDIAVLTAADPDHLDIYQDQNTIEEAFRTFLARVPNENDLILNQQAASKLYSTPPVSAQYYSLENSPIHAENLMTKNGRFIFDYVSPDITIPNIPLLMSGFHNVANALAAITVALKVGLSWEEIQAGFASFEGIKRRFEFIVEKPNNVFIDDYAHHPEEITALLKSVRKLYPHKQVTIIFQPHLFTRTRDFAQGFSESLRLADRAILLPIYPARELPIPGITSELIFKEISIKEKYLCEKEALLDLLSKELQLDKKSDQVVLTVGAGDIDRLVNPIQDWLIEN